MYSKLGQILEITVQFDSIILDLLVLHSHRFTHFYCNLIFANWVILRCSRLLAQLADCSDLCFALIKSDVVALFGFHIRFLLFAHKLLLEFRSFECQHVIVYSSGGLSI